MVIKLDYYNVFVCYLHSYFRDSIMRAMVNYFLMNYIKLYIN